MKNILTFLGILCMLALFWKCTPSEIPPEPTITGINFVPLQKGQYIEYEVNEIRFFVVEPSETLKYQLRELIADTFRDLEGELSYRLERFTRQQSGQVWELDSVWTAKINQNRFIKVENNIPYIRLVFPPAENKTWNGNALNTLAEQSYKIQNLGETLQIERFEFKNSLKVLQANDSNLVFLKKSQEIYAENIGLVQKDYTFIQYCNEANCLGQGKISFGTIYTQKIIDYGILR